MKISLIIPVYNAEKFLTKTLMSLEQQTVKNFEVVIVDDGSTDNSVKIIDLFKSKINIKLISQKNSGVSAARNNGIIHSNGEYIMFLDSDDYLVENSIEIISKEIEKKKYDIYLFDYYLEIKQKKIRVNYMYAYENKIDLTKGILKGEKLGVVWNKVFSRNKLFSNNILFNEKLKYCEDELFLLNYLAKCNNVSYIPECLYSYVQHENSITNRYDANFYNNQFLPYYLEVFKIADLEQYKSLFFLKIIRIRIYIYRNFNNIGLDLKKLIINEININDLVFNYGYKEKILFIIGRFDIFLKLYSLFKGGLK